MIDLVLVVCVYVIVCVGVIFCVFDVEDVDVGVVVVDEIEVVYLLQQQVVGVVQDFCVWVVIYYIEEVFEGCVVVQVFVGVEFEVQVYVVGIECIQDWVLVMVEFGEGFFYQFWWVLWLWIEVGLGQCIGECGVCGQFQVLVGLCSELQLFYGLGLVCWWVVVYVYGCEFVEQVVVGGMDCDQLFLQVG